MTTYMVRLKGENFLMAGDQGPRKRRFHSTRIIEAENPRRAETLARNLIRKDTRLQNSVLNEVSDPPLISLESIREISAMAYDAQNRAHSFYWDDENIKE
jgi:hypothetical protein